MATAKVDVYGMLEKIKKHKPVIHHLTNWVTINDCANVVKVLGASPVMAHAPEEVEEMAGLASALVLNIGTLTVDFVDSMKKAALSANKKGIPVILDVCGAGATDLRDHKCFELLDAVHIAIIKGNASEIARIGGAAAKTKGVDSGSVPADLRKLAAGLAQKYGCTVVTTGKEDIVTDGKRNYTVKNGHPMMANIVGTGCMAASVIGTFAAVEPDYPNASVAGLVCFEIAAECAAQKSKGPGAFKERLLDALYNLKKKTISKRQKVET
ncbi:MAG TPA: hydroxyethylthiazole kinase [Candidatus Omnitrophota bacterium]|nr:hydroxyethylthiazole kinase [Candidatus Omnitrophota bacterium]